jgi:hypothetical protein
MSSSENNGSAAKKRKVAANGTTGTMRVKVCLNVFSCLFFQHFYIYFFSSFFPSLIEKEEKS